EKNDAELDFQMTFDRQTVIQRVNTESGHVQPEYLCIASVPRAGDPDDRYDVLGIILYVEEHAREITIGQDRQALVREIVLSDHRARHHQDVLSDRQARVLDVRNPSSERVIMTVNALKWKRARQLCLNNTNTLQDERCWIQVVVPEPKLEKVHAYLGCPNRGKTTYTPVGQAYKCLTCKRQGVISSPRVTFNCEVFDATGTYALISITEDSEKIFGITAADLFRMKHTADARTSASAHELLSTRHVLMEVGPTMSLAKSNDVQWCLKKVVINDAPHEEDAGQAVAQDVNQGATASIEEDGDHAIAEDTDHTHTAPVKD
ncbi:hypothetical protein SOVF_025450, partial [Spinacia oleracea]